MSDDDGYCDVADRPLPEPPCGLELPCPTHDGPEPTIFLWTANNVPMTGKLALYADLWMQSQYGADIWLSSTVLTWDDSSDPVTYKVKVTRGEASEDDFIPHTFTVPGHEPKESVTVFLDGRG